MLCHVHRLRLTPPRHRPISFRAGLGAGAAARRPQPLRRDVALEAQLGLLAATPNPGKIRWPLPIPLHPFSFWPLVYTSYAIAQAVWMVALHLF